VTADPARVQRDKLAAALVRALNPILSVQYSHGPVIDARTADAEVLAERVVDALLSVVQALVAEGQAEALQAAADDIESRCVLNKHEAASVLRARAAALVPAASEEGA
jgi:hypothetical protein